MRWEHNFQRAMVVPEQSAVLLGLLMLRGPQTAGELRIHSERWYRFADISSVEGFLEELRDRSRAQGRPAGRPAAARRRVREPRWAHLLCGPVDVSAAAVAETRRRRRRWAWPPACAALEAEVAELRAVVTDLATQLGLSPPGQPETNDRA